MVRPLNRLVRSVAWNRWQYGVLGGILTLGLAATWRIADMSDATMREQLHTTAHMVANSIDVAQIQALSGSEADLNAESYLRMKSKLADIRSANMRCRFLYLLRMNDIGDVVFLVDSEPQDSKDCSPPGQVYSEISEDDRRIFADGIGHVIGPYTDRWGTWISGMVPIFDSRAGKVVAIFGMDIDAGDWKREILIKCIAPVSTTLFVILIHIVFFMINSRSWSENRRLTLAKAVIEEAEARQRQELAFAADVQKLMLAPLPASLGSVVVDGVFMTKSNAGGDYYDFISDPFGVDHVLVADISGHDLAASLFCSAIGIMFKQAAPFADIPNEFMSLLNHEFLSIAADSGKFATVLYVQINMRTNRIRFVNAGHPPAYIVNASGVKTRIESSGMPIGIIKDERWQVFETDFQPGDAVLVLTDGLIEARDADGNFFGVDGLEGVIAAILHGRDGEKLPDKLADSIIAEIEKMPFVIDDDITILEIRPKPI